MVQLPKGWVRTDLGSIVDYGKTIKADLEKVSPDSWVLELEDIEKNSSKLLKRCSFDERHPKSSKNSFDKGDVLYGKLRPYLNKMLIAPEDGICTTEIVPLKTNSELFESRFLFYWLKGRQFGDYVNTVSYGVNMPRLGTKDGKKAPMVVAPLLEQKRIVEKLDEVLAQVDTIKARLDGIPDLLKCFRQSVLASGVSGKLIPVKAPRQIKISDVTEDIRYGTSKKCDYNGGKTPVVRIPNIGDRKLDITDLKSADFTDKELDKLSLLAGDILVIRSNGSLELVAKPALVEKEYEGYLFAGYLIRVRCNEELVLPSFLLNVLCSRVVRDVVELGARSTSGVNNINSKELSALEFVLPSIEEQKEIVRLVDQYFAFADNIEAQVKKAQARVDNLTQSILAKAFRGELVPQDPNDESADKLLERIAKAREEAEALAKAAKKAEAAKKRAAKATK
ncbi:type I restriction enzyme, S subunit [Vibrio crassostreae]|nr:type I restriction enzyme, S subunit [Vibrio crassostreae]CAK1767755.1 type I restriction enzyme, S subunit [Vibrio crassostreae]CAK1799407.1 type I restriction enzyme, S subunit [Vibrio crassostreae]CAK2264380.1 type I restriction enzyme, S subunit [Vibrio crassostreae]CAK2615239.1 type I restriction enzyme, S subunit [Vibrio crassostreae]